ncbi:MAG: hypothetical protein CMI18_14275 [Opitutaceae bacterium]|nr:hypothetical protein [Opitutaceae bacterium]
MIKTQLVENGQLVFLELVIAKPDGKSPFPNLAFNYISTGIGSDPNILGITRTSPRIADYLNYPGWMVVFPQRRGRGKSDGLNH